MNKTLILIDCQKDFISGALSNQEAQKKVPAIAEFAKNFDGPVVMTRDSHDEDYLNTQEGRNLPIVHCIMNTDGWNIDESIFDSVYESHDPNDIWLVDKDAFGYDGWGHIKDVWMADEIHVAGFVTDICVVSNVLVLKAMFPETKIVLHADLCAGLTPEKHEAALEVMRSCQVEVI